MASYKNIFKITHNDVLPLFKEGILIAEPFLQDAHLTFRRIINRAYGTRIDGICLE